MHVHARRLREYLEAVGPAEFREGTPGPRNMGHRRPSVRALHAASLHRRGSTFRAIGVALKVSTARAWQLVAKGERLRARLEGGDDPDPPVER